VREDRRGKRGKDRGGAGMEGEWTPRVGSHPHVGNPEKYPVLAHSVPVYVCA